MLCGRMEPQDHAPRLHGARGRKLRQAMGKSGGDDDNEGIAIKTIAHAIADGDERPLANKQGVELIESCPRLTVRRLMAAYGHISLVSDIGETQSRGRTAPLPLPTRPRPPQDGR